MRRDLGTIAACAIVLSCAGLGMARADVNDQLKLKLMETTKVVPVPHPKVSPEKFVSDGDSNTLELVFIDDTAKGASRVSDDGEVIFLSPNVTTAEQAALINKAFDIRLKRLDGNPPTK